MFVPTIYFHVLRENTTVFFRLHAAISVDPRINYLMEAEVVSQVILLESNTLGAPDEKLGAILMSNCLRLLGQRQDLPEYIILLNAGVLLATEGAETLEHLQALDRQGVKIVSCRTCVDYFDIEKDIAVGVIDGMVAILEILATRNVVTI